MYLFVLNEISFIATTLFMLFASLYLVCYCENGRWGFTKMITLLFTCYDIGTIGKKITTYFIHNCTRTTKINVVVKKTMVDTFFLIKYLRKHRYLSQG